MAVSGEFEEDLLELSNDIGNLNRLVMTRQGRYYDETPYNLEQKLADNLWWLLELSDVFRYSG